MGPERAPPARVTQPLGPCLGDQLGTRTAFNAQPSQRLEKARAQSERLQRAALAVSHQFENSNGRAQARCSKVEWQICGMFVPHRNGGRADQHSGVVGERKSKRERGSLSCILQDAQWQRGP